jgi:hypothetical protein
MAGYAVMTRIDHVGPRLADRIDDVMFDPALLTTGTPSNDVFEPVPDDGLAERLASFRERWAQTTFFLFDPESWRR